MFGIIGIFYSVSLAKYASKHFGKSKLLEKIQEKEIDLIKEELES